MQRHEVPLRGAESWGGGGWGRTASAPPAGACEPSGGVVPSRRALRARIENAPHSRGKRPKPKKADTGDHNAPARARGRPYGIQWQGVALCLRHVRRRCRSIRPIALSK